MLLDARDPEQQAFYERIAATAIVNQAAIKCMMAGVAISEENVTRLIGDFVDPARPDAGGLIEAIMHTLDELVANSTLTQRDLTS
jgi:hypothetical protein